MEWRLPNCRQSHEFKPRYVHHLRGVEGKTEPYDAKQSGLGLVPIFSLRRRSCSNNESTIRQRKNEALETKGRPRRKVAVQEYLRRDGSNCETKRSRWTLGWSSNLCGENCTPSNDYFHCFREAEETFVIFRSDPF
mgnify:FL=1